MNSSPCLNKQTPLVTWVDLGNNANRSIFVILQPNHKGWHQKLYSLVTSIGREEIELYLENIRTPGYGMNASGNSKFHIRCGIDKLDCHLAHIMEGTRAKK